MLNFCDVIQVYVFSTNHHLNDRIGRLNYQTMIFSPFSACLILRFCAIENTLNTGLSVENNSRCRLTNISD